METPVLYRMKQLLAAAEQGGYAVGAFSPRYSSMIHAVLRAGEAQRSPLLVQIAQIEMKWYDLTVEEFAADFWEQLAEVRPTVPVGLHLDHTQDFNVIAAAIQHGFTSVMIDASAKPLTENIAITREVVEYAHARNVSVEAELGRIGSADFIESETDEELFTDPDEAEQFVRQTGVDALAVSVGTAHGVYRVRQPRIDLQRLKDIRTRTPVHMVLHGGSGTPADLIRAAIRLPGGGVSKINIATDLELGLLQALQREERMTNAALKALSPQERALAAQAVQAVVEDKIVNFLGSNGHAQGFAAPA